MAKTIQPLIRIENVDVALDGRLVLSGLSWALRPGQHWAILGGNGAGKSTFLRLIRGELWPAPGRGGRRIYSFNGQPQTSAVGIKELVALVSPELQNRYLQQEWTLTALQVIRSGFHATDFVSQPLTGAQEDAALASIKLIGVQDLLSRNVQTLSTGELRKVLVARALVSNPRVLVCDEICDGLDAAARTSLLAALERLALCGTQLLYTTHREEELLPVLTHRLRLDQGRISHCEAIPRPRIADRPRWSSAAPPDAADLDRNLATGLSQCSRLVRLAADEDTRPSRRRFSDRDQVVPGPGLFTVQTSPAPVEATPRGQLRIDIRSANVYHDHRQALFDITLQVREGEHWAVFGPNGSGKTTLLKLILGDIHAALGGSVRRFAFTPRDTIWEVKRRLGWVSPDLQSHYHESLTGAEVIASGFKSSIGLMQKVTRAQWRCVSEIVDALGLSGVAGRSMRQLSYGELRKILIARSLVHRPELLICDEPFDGLDTAARGEVTRMLEQVARRGAGLIMVTHHPRDLPRCTTHVAALQAGRLVFRGTVAEFATRSLDAVS
jgi:molybdate transport system ATP-binding protein